MADPFVGEIRLFAGSFAPRGWALCDGQLLSIPQYDALFSLFGTIYGGDGRTTFGLPSLRGRVPLHMGNGPGLTPRPIGQKSGEENVTLNVNQMPEHRHDWNASDGTANSANPKDLVFAEAQSQVYADDFSAAALKSDAATSYGGGQQHTNVMPFQCINFIVSLTGVYPSRN
jgi:microcystin-dependent protein